MNFKLEKFQQIEIWCTPEDLRELAKEMEHEYKHGNTSWRKYIEKKNLAVIFCLDGERMDIEEELRADLKKERDLKQIELKVKSGKL